MKNKIKVIEENIEKILKTTDFDNFSEEQKNNIKNYINSILIDIKLIKYLDDNLIKNIKEKINEL
jgi:hypothetical protein